jgi:hypothetical protein
MATAFISYSHRDEVSRQELEVHLAPLKRQGLLSVWHDRRITAGDSLDEAISENLENADLILMLISADFVASEYCYTREMTRALERHEAKAARAISIICRPCDFHKLPFAKFMLLPTDAKAVSLWTDRDAAWVDVVKGIRGALAAQATPPRPARPSPQNPQRVPAQATPASPSRGLRLPKTFTDLDRHDFLDAAFERIWEVFQANAVELETQSAGVVVRPVRIDAQAFSVRIFVNGSEVGGGSVYHGGGAFGRDQICFSTDASAPRNSMNEWFCVEIDESGLALKSGGMLRMMAGGRGPSVDADQAAELLWDSILEQVKARVK